MIMKSKIIELLVSELNESVIEGFKSLSITILDNNGYYLAIIDTITKVEFNTCSISLFSDIYNYLNNDTISYYVGSLVIRENLKIKLTINY